MRTVLSTRKQSLGAAKPDLEWWLVELEPKVHMSLDGLVGRSLGYYPLAASYLASSALFPFQDPYLGQPGTLVSRTTVLTKVTQHVVEDSDIEC